MFPTITARVTFRDFKSCNNIPSSMFFIPRDYKVSHGESGLYQINAALGPCEPNISPSGPPTQPIST